MRRIVRRRTSWGFTLIEILAAVIVLVLLLAILVQVTTDINQVIRLSKQLDDPAGQSRIAFDRIARDLTGLIKRSDTDFVAQNVATGPFAAATTNDILLFLSDVPSASTTSVLQTNNRGLSLVAYQVSNPDATTGPCLIRSGIPVAWTPGAGAVAASFMGLQANGLPVPLSQVPANLLPASNSDFDILSAGTIRMVVGFQLYPDNQPVTLDDSTVVLNATGQVVYHAPIKSLTPLTPSGATPVKYVDLTRVSALVIGLVVLNVDSLKLLSSTQITTLGNTFATPVDGALPVASWSATASNENAMPASIPLPARQSVRVFQHFFPVNPMGGSRL